MGDWGNGGFGEGVWVHYFVPWGMIAKVLIILQGGGLKVACVPQPLERATGAHRHPLRRSGKRCLGRS